MNYRPGGLGARAVRRLSASGRTWRVGPGVAGAETGEQGRSPLGGRERPCSAHEITPGSGRCHFGGLGPSCTARSRRRRLRLTRVDGEHEGVGTALASAGARLGGTPSDRLDCAGRAPPTPPCRRRCTPRWDSANTRQRVTGGREARAGRPANRRKGGRYWVRTSALFGVNEARYHCANRPDDPGDGVRAPQRLAHPAPVLTSGSRPGHVAAEQLTSGHRSDPVTDFFGGKSGHKRTHQCGAPTTSEKTFIYLFGLPS